MSRCGNMVVKLTGVILVGVGSTCAATLETPLKSAQLGSWIYQCDTTCTMQPYSSDTSFQSPHVQLRRASIGEPWELWFNAPPKSNAVSLRAGTGAQLLLEAKPDFDSSVLDNRYQALRNQQAKYTLLRQLQKSESLTLIAHPSGTESEFTLRGMREAMRAVESYLNSQEVAQAEHIQASTPNPTNMPNQTTSVPGWVDSLPQAQAAVQGCHEWSPGDDWLLAGINFEGGSYKITLGTLSGSRIQCEISADGQELKDILTDMPAGDTPLLSETEPASPECAHELSREQGWLIWPDCLQKSKSSK